MTWATSSFPVPCADDSNCQHDGCSSSATVRIVCVETETRQRRSASSCTAHADLVRAKLLWQPAVAPPRPPSPPPSLPTPLVPPRRAALRFTIPPNAPSGICKACRATIAWIQPKGKLMPVDPDGTSHFATCPEAASFRNPR